MSKFMFNIVSHKTENPIFLLNGKPSLDEIRVYVESGNMVVLAERFLDKIKEIEKDSPITYVSIEFTDKDVDKYFTDTVKDEKSKTNQ